MMWGTILALWSTGALVAAAARQLDIHSAGAGSLAQRDTHITAAQHDLPVPAAAAHTC